MKKNEITDGQHMAVFGVTRSGKTHFVKDFIKDETRYVVFDPDEEYVGAGVHAVKSVEDLRAVLNDCAEGNFRISFKPEYGDEEEQLAAVARLIWVMQETMIESERFAARNILFVVDEIADSYPNRKSNFQDFGKLIRRGAKRGVSIIGISQRPADVNVMFRSQVMSMVSFAFTTPHDVDAIMKITRGEGASDLSSLAKYHSLIWLNGQGVRVAPPAG